MPPLTTSSDRLGFVAIGRNEGDRLKACLRAIKLHCPGCPIVYVDSGSSDDSVEFALSEKLTVVELDMTVPFTAARARNEGYRRLLSQHPNLTFVQFFDGDCEMVEGWIDAAMKALGADPKIGIVSGRRMEKFLNASIYNTLMDIEWNTPVGETRAVLGDMCVRVEAFELVGGFDGSIIAAEDDDFCIRVRKAGYKVYRIDAPMSRHDANIMSISQWYRRSKRGGHGYANLNHVHGGKPDYYFRKELMSVTFWGALFPLSALIFLIVQPWVSLALVLIYALFIVKTLVRRKRKGDSLKVAFYYAFLIYTGKTAEFLGGLQYWKNLLLAQKHQLIEYK
jgi:GT2 family glycosyltransferase